jgi:hypothetical protein
VGDVRVQLSGDGGGADAPVKQSDGVRLGLEDRDDGAVDAARHRDPLKEPGGGVRAGWCRAGHSAG